MTEHIIKALSNPGHAQELAANPELEVSVKQLVCENKSLHIKF